MLKSLLIRNYALIDELEVGFSGGLIIITGETGAGKSIIIDALGLALGERANSEAVRSGAERAVVEAVFTIAENRLLGSLMEQHGIEPAPELIARREVTARGQSRCFLNDSPVTLGVLKEIGDALVDLHGQHEHQSLLRPATHGALLDEFGGLGGILDEFRRSHAQLQESAARLAETRARERQLREKRELYDFQLREIDAVAPHPGEEEELSTELRILENAEKLFGTTGGVYDLLYGAESSLHERLVIARNQLHDLASIDARFEEAARECGSAETTVRELAKFIQSYNARVEFNPARLDQVRDRLGRLALLKRKHGGSVEALLAHREHLAAELALAENFDEVLRGLERTVEEHRADCGARAARLSAKRREMARALDRAAKSELAALGIPHGVFHTRIVRPAAAGAPDALTVAVDGGEAVLNPRGIDDVEFLLSTNPGEEPRPLARVASGGEISRVMLALKTLLAKSDRLPVLVFDEIDVGVSGRIARVVGLSLKRLSRFHQVVAITHLPQIAGLADEHHAVKKISRNGRTLTTMELLRDEERVLEVAKLVSGERVTDAARATARELMTMKKGE